LFEFSLKKLLKSRAMTPRAFVGAMEISHGYQDSYSQQIYENMGQTDVLNRPTVRNDR
jgi:hypothetical protein